MLVSLLSLAVGLGVDGCPQCLAECLPDPRYKLGSPVRDHVHGDPMKAEHMLDQQRSIYNGEDDCVTLWGGGVQ